MPREFASGIQHVEVAALPAASANPRVTLSQGGKLWWSDGATWIDLGAGGRTWFTSTTAQTMVPGRAYLVDSGAISDDPNWAQVAALLSFDGDLSDATGNVWTSSNNFLSSTAQSRFGGASGRWPATNAAASTPSATKLNMPGDFCFDFWWFRPAAFTTPSDVIHRGAGASASQFAIYLASDLSLRFYSNNADVLSTGPIATDAMQAVRFNRSGNTLAAYVNGTRTGTVTFTNNLTNTNALELGRVGFNANPAGCHIDEFRLTVGAARETGASYTVATSAFPRAGSIIDHIIPAVIAPGDEFLVYVAAGGARIVPGAGRQVGNAGVGINVTLNPGQRAWLVARSATQLELVP